MNAAGQPMSESVAALSGQLEAATADVVDLFARLTGPPATSLERRRIAGEAERITDALVGIAAGLRALDAAAQPGSGLADTVFDIAEAQQELDRARTQLHSAVDAARADGASWREVGNALGIAGQTAHKRFDANARRRHADYMRVRYQRLSATGGGRGQGRPRSP